MKLFIPLLIVGLCASVNAQLLKKNKSVNKDSLSDKEDIVRNSSEKDSLKIFRPTIKDYRNFSEFGEKKYIDTVLTYDKNYSFTQYNNKDNFGRLPFSNIGAGFNPLVFERNTMSDLSILPTNKSYFLLAPKEVQYYDVKTPTTSFIYHNAVNNGAALTSTYTQNFRKGFNISAQYMGLRSQGNYVEQLAVSNTVLFTTNYASKNGKYQLFAHFLDQNIRNEENGGIRDNDLFLSGTEAIRNRNNLLVNLTNANTRFALRRYYFTHRFAPFNRPSIPFNLKHTFNYQLNKYYYGEPSVQKMYYTDNAELIDYPTHTGKFSNNLSNTFFLVWDNEAFKLDAGLRHQWIRLGIADALVHHSLSVPTQILEQRLGAVGNLRIKLWNRFFLDSSAEISRGNLFGNQLLSENTMKFEPMPNYFVEAHLNFQSAYPSFNLMLNASPYRKHNYFHSNWSHQNILTTGGSIAVPWFSTKLYANFRNISNYVYLNAQSLPEQMDTPLSIAEIGGETTLNYGKFFLNTKLHFQRVIDGQSVLPLPNLIARANAFYQSKVFKNAAEIQTGIKVNYFNSFASRAYFPLLNEFQLSATPFSIGGKPIIDAYINMKVKRMFFFVEGQNLLTLAQKNTAYTAPDYPFQDFRLNIGIVWYLIN